MADENIQEVEQTEEPQGETKAKTDWKAEARKWENLAKKGKAAEEELAKLKESQMTEQEKAKARAEKAEQELAQLKAEAERMQQARELSKSEGIPLEVLESFVAGDIEAFCKVYRATQPTIHAASTGTPFMPSKGGAKADPRSAFVAFAESQFNK